MTIYSKMMLGFTIIIVLMMCADAYILRELYIVAGITRNTLTLDVQSVDLAKQLRAVLFDEERFAQKYTVTSDSSYRILFVEQSRLFNQYIDSLDHYPSDPAGRRLLAEVDRRHAWHFNAVMRHAPGMIVIPKEQQARTDTLDYLYRAFDDLIRVKQASVSRTVAEVEHTTSRSVQIALFLTVGTLVAAIALAFFLSRTITRPLNLFVRGTEEVARGSFARIEVSTKGEIARMAAAFNKMSESLASANAARADMMQHISHELRMPLQTMHSAYYLLTEQQAGSLNQAQLRLLGSIRDNIDKIARFSNQFLDLARIEAGMMEFELARTELINIVKLAVDDAGVTAERKGIVLSLESQPVSEVMVNPEKTQQIFTNLLSNAVKYTNTGGTITVSILPSERGVRVSVTDSGIGIAEEDLPKVFEKFYRAKTALKGKAKGTGIGLALVKALTEGQGGRIFASSTAGVGSTFTVEFPAAKIKETVEQ